MAKSVSGASAESSAKDLMHIVGNCPWHKRETTSEGDCKNSTCDTELFESGELRDAGSSDMRGLATRGLRSIG